MFLMMSNDEKLETWNKVSTLQKAKYWELMQNEYFHDEDEHANFLKKPTVKVSKNNHYSEEESWNSEESPISKKLDRYSILIEGEKEEDRGLTSGRRHHEHFENFSQYASESSKIQEAWESDYPQNSELKPAQLRLFHASIQSHPEEVYNLWFNHFNIFQKVALWNKLSFGGKCQKTGTTAERAIMIFKQLINSKKINRALKHDTKGKKQFTLLYENRRPDDTKTMLWFPLSDEDKARMIVCQKDDEEAEIMMGLAL